MKKAWYVAAILAVIIACSFAATGCGCNGEEATTVVTVPSKITTPSSTSPGSTATVPFEQQRYENVQTPHYVSSDPANNAILTTSPTEVSIRFDFNLGSENSISVTRDAKSVVTGPLKLSPDKLMMSLPIDGNATGNYAVKYVASWPDGSTHDGSFGFSVQLP